MQPLKRYIVNNGVITAKSVKLFKAMPAYSKVIKGDVFSVVGHYQERTFWEWLRFKPRKLIQWEVR